MERNVKIIEKEGERDFRLMKLQISTYFPFIILQLVSLHPICQIRNDKFRAGYNYLQCPFHESSSKCPKFRSHVILECENGHKNQLLYFTI
jgi:hypothetical protein